ncbi:pituitary tumor-transforming gene 1 protein-interacting protein-like [Carassius auratus]|uniref:Pituitary tumor-transforming gene 1 protein-interacting protein-like n=1 Tax=Carassius auratus TaxID=7957 RepID=A0A6P6LJE2_CARAU|nr:pituitary tumor-transforming gene 1 protein-interacting protein-like [Carassius auratus]XP_052473769.1 pituitary tumor-transforming gene 1 protein-interacting protein [Carassius gibelio]
MDKSRVIVSMFSFLLMCVAFSLSEATTTTSKSTIITPTTPPAVHKPCNTQTSCETCLANVSCLWCQTNSSCSDYPVSYVIPPASLCKLSQARWGVCWVNFEALIIAMAVVCGILLLAVTVCCCCCCCKRRRSSSFDRDDEQFARRREEIKQRSEERKAERKVKHDEIRKKYGLIPDSDHPYSKFENE